MSAPIRAALYVRMSTDRQEYSAENQEEYLRKHAAAGGIEVVQVFADEGKSGLKLKGRHAFQRLIELVQSGNADFTMILVYDMSRWGRFQNTDEGAFYEFLCTKAGITVRYCAEVFDKLDPQGAAVIKPLMRWNAGVYSAGLSNKVYLGQCNLIKIGFRQGGPPGYGLQRHLLDSSGNPKQPLKRGEHKSLQTERVILVPGPPDEIETVRRIYRLFIDERRVEREIADTLNREGVIGENGRRWTRGTVHQVLTNEKYIGHNVYSRTSFKLKEKRVRNPPDKWIRRDNAFQAIVDQADFERAREIVLERHKRVTDEELLEKLRALANRHGRLSGLIIDETDGMPSSSMYAHRFGSLIAAYQAISYDTGRDYSYLEVNKRLRAMHPEIVKDTIAKIEERHGTVVQDAHSGLLTVNRIFTASIVLARCQTIEDRGHRWHIRFDESLLPDLTIAIRMDHKNEAALDYFILPSLEFRTGSLAIREDLGTFLESFRFQTLDYFFSLAELVSVVEAAA